jgi:hypothetical protein
MEKLMALHPKDGAGELLLATHPSPDARRLSMARQVNKEIEKAAVSSASASRFQQYIK